MVICEKGKFDTLTNAILIDRFSDDKTTWDIDRQFLWGPSLLISPVLDKVKKTECYFVDIFAYIYYFHRLMAFQNLVIDSLEIIMLKEVLAIEGLCYEIVYLKK